jgi:hypothetical protein
MNDDCPLYPILLGSGGENPRVEIFSTGSQKPREVLGLPPLNSVYAIDIRVEENLFAVGTKGGLIFILEGVGQHLDLEETVWNQKLAQGAPILSVCWINKDLLAVSDTAGRCFLWYLNIQMPPQPLETENGAICSLLNLKEDFLVGLSSGGTLHFWDPLQGKLVRTINIPHPPKMSGLVRLVHWPAESALVFPAQKGCLTHYNIFADSIITTGAHSAEVYAITVEGENLITAGINDDQLKIWSSASKKPARQVQAFKGIVSMEAIGVNQSKLLLIESGGTAGVFKIQQNSLKPINRLSGKDYRVVLGPSLESIKVLFDQRRLAEIRQLTSQILEKNNQVSPDVIKSCYSRLDGLGFGHISLALQAEQAIEKKDTVEGIRIRLSLQNMLPHNDPNALPSIKEYADLLAKAWHIEEAYDAYQKILSIDPRYPLGIKIHELRRIADILSANFNWIIEPDIAIDQIIQSAKAIGKAFIGRYVIKKHKAIQCGHAKISANRIVIKFEQIRKELKDNGLPPAMKEKAWWISRAGIEKVNMVTFGKGNDNCIKGLQFALEVINSGLAAVVIPLILFDWRDIGLGGAIEDRNESALKHLADITTKVSSNSYLAMIHKTVLQTLSRLVTANTLRKEFN